MKPTTPFGKIDTPNLFPTTKAQVIDVARRWNNPGLIKINKDVIKNLDLSHIKPGLEFGMISNPLQKMPWIERVKLALVVNSINHKFWEMGPNGYERYEFEGVIGASGMRNALEKAWFDDQSPLGQRRLHGYFLTEQDVVEMFGNISDPSSRADILNEIVSDRLDAEAQALAGHISASGGVDVSMAARLATAFPKSFADPVLKKAQLSLSEVWVAGLERGYEYEADLTAFADYQIPNVLRALGVLEYNDKLAQKIDSQTLIPEGSGDELALRGASILAVEEIAKQFNLPVAAVDHYLWTQRKISPFHFHLTDTTLY